MVPKSLPSDLAAGFRGKIVLERQATIPKSFDVENLGPGFGSGVAADLGKDHAPTRGAVGNIVIGS
jgi:hypothetical protein